MKDMIEAMFSASMLDALALLKLGKRIFMSGAIGKVL